MYNLNNIIDHKLYMCTYEYLDKSVKFEVEREMYKLIKQQLYIEMCQEIYSKLTKIKS